MSSLLWPSLIDHIWVILSCNFYAYNTVRYSHGNEAQTMQATQDLDTLVQENIFPSAFNFQKPLFLTSRISVICHPPNSTVVDCPTVPKCTFCMGTDSICLETHHAVGLSGREFCPPFLFWPTDATVCHGGSQKVPVDAQIVKLQYYIGTKYNKG